MRRWERTADEAGVSFSRITCADKRRPTTVGPARANETAHRGGGALGPHLRRDSHICAGTLSHICAGTLPRGAAQSPRSSARPRCGNKPQRRIGHGAPEATCGTARHGTARHGACGLQRAPSMARSGIATVCGPAGLRCEVRSQGRHCRFSRKTPCSPLDATAACSWARRCHICAGTGPAPATSAPGLGSTQSRFCEKRGLTAEASCQSPEPSPAATQGCSAFRRTS